MQSKRFVSLVVVGIALACSAGAAVPDVKADNPDYTAWASFKPGATSTKRSEEMVDGKVVRASEMTYTLKSADAETVVIEQVTTGQKGTRTIKRTDWSGAPPSNERTEGDEEIEVLGRKLKCHWIQIIGKRPESSMAFKFYTSAEVPGGTVKSDMTIERTKDGKTTTTKSTIVLLSFDAKK